MTFPRSFELAGVVYPLPAGSYEIISDEELIEGLSFPVYRRVSTWIMARRSPGAATEMVPIDPDELAKVQASQLDAKESSIT
ncbi:MAG TPA: hypothetical protein VFO36_04495 [Nitrospiraceae bacterium]|nr:hypothetical protein [Nitrospiraceae bacterium]